MTFYTVLKQNRRNVVGERGRGLACRKSDFRESKCEQCDRDGDQDRPRRRPLLGIAHWGWRGSGELCGPMPTLFSQAANHSGFDRNIDSYIEAVFGMSSRIYLVYRVYCDFR